MNAPTPRLQIAALPDDEACLVLSGEIDAHTAPDLAGHLDPLPGDSGDVVLDVAAIEFIDSSGLRLVVEAHQRAETDGRRLVIRTPSPALMRLLEISGLIDHLTIDVPQSVDAPDPI